DRARDHDLDQREPCFGAARPSSAHRRLPPPEPPPREPPPPEPPPPEPPPPEPPPPEPPPPEPPPPESGCDPRPWSVLSIAAASVKNATTLSVRFSPSTSHSRNSVTLRIESRRTSCTIWYCDCTNDAPICASMSPALSPPNEPSI